MWFGEALRSLNLMFACKALLFQLHIHTERYVPIYELLPNEIYWYKYLVHMVVEGHRTKQKQSDVCVRNHLSFSEIRYGALDKNWPRY
jgi:hypothetical protein